MSKKENSSNEQTTGNIRLGNRVEPRKRLQQYGLGRCHDGKKELVKSGQGNRPETFTNRMRCS